MKLSSIPLRIPFWITSQYYYCFCFSTNIENKAKQQHKVECLQKGFHPWKHEQTDTAHTDRQALSHDLCFWHCSLFRRGTSFFFSVCPCWKHSLYKFWYLEFLTSDFDFKYMEVDRRTRSIYHIFSFLFS